MKQLLILGGGYTGQAIYKFATAQELAVRATSRAPARHLSSLPSDHRIAFDLARPETWENVSPDIPIIWCFPAVPLEAVMAFAERCAAGARKLIVLGSTSAYDPPSPRTGIAAAALVDERTPVNLQRPRVQGEEYLRVQHGAIILRVAGIYGPGRNVLKWIREGRVRPSPKYVNLIHVEDLAGVCLAALERGVSGESYNVSDGTPRRWSEICEQAHKRWNITIGGEKQDIHPGKRIAIAKLTGELGYRFTHPDLYAALEEIESSEH